MKTRMRWACFTIILLLLTACSGLGGPDRELRRALEPVLDEWRIANWAPGAALVVAREGHEPLVMASSLATLEPRRRMTGKERFEVVGITRTFVAAAVLQLVQEGGLALDDPISNYLGPFPRGDVITLRHLLSHRSGLPEFHDDPDNQRAIASDLARRWTLPELVNLAAEGTPYFEPGATYRYTDADYVVAAAIVEAVTDASLADVLRRRFFEPLGMEDTFVAGLEPEIGPFLSGYLPCHIDPAPLLIELHGDRIACQVGYLDVAALPGYQQATFNMGAWGIVSTAQDLLVWGRALFQGDVLSPVARQEMLAFDPSLGSYGLGIMQIRSPENDVTWGHSGGSWGMESILVYFPGRNLFLVAYANGGYSGNLRYLVDGVQDVILERSLAEPGVTPERSVTALLTALQDADPEVRRQAAADLGRQGPAATGVAEALIEVLLRDPAWEVRAEAAQALGQIGPRDAVAESLRQAALNDPHEAVRREAQLALSSLQP